MLEVVRGYTAAALDAVEREDQASFDQVERDMGGVAQLLLQSEDLRRAVTDPSLPTSVRQTIIEELLSGKIGEQALKILTFTTAAERPGELPRTIEHLVELVEAAEDSAQSEGGRRNVAEPPAGRGGALERIRGYANYELELVAEPDKVDEMEDELFRFSRILESTTELRDALADQDLPPRVRLDVLYDLLGGKVEDSTVRLVAYCLRAGRLRDLVGTLGFLVELVADDRGRRVGHVRAVLELSEDEQARLRDALGRIVRRPVELRVTIDSSILGGLEVVVGDTIIDGTLRHRLDQLRDTLLQRT